MIRSLIRGLITGFLLVIVMAASAAAAKTKADQKVPEALVALDNRNGPAYAILVDKGRQQLLLYAYDGAYHPIYRMACSTGEVRGPKKRSGDKRTPEGVYFFTREHQKRDLSPIYGSRAYPIDYPNLMDRMAGNGGNAIWLHGTNKSLKPMDSNGCIVLNNEDIDRLPRYIILNKTPIIIVDQLAYRSSEQTAATQQRIQDLLDVWRRAIEGGSYHQYLAHYDADYVPDIAWWRHWNRTGCARDFRSDSLP